MAKNSDPMRRNDEKWANNIPVYRDPATGKKVNSVGDYRPESQVRQRPVDPKAGNFK